MARAHVNEFPTGGIGVSADRPSLKHDLETAVIAGQISGLIMAIVMMLVFALFLGQSPLYPVQVIGSFAFGDAALQGFNIKALLAGLVLHQFGPTLFWSVIFGLLLRSLHLRHGLGLVLLGIATGLASQIVDVNLILPAAMNALHGHNIWAEQVPAFWSWAAHLVFGLGLAVFPAVDRRLTSRSSDGRNRPH